MGVSVDLDVHRTFVVQLQRAVRIVLRLHNCYQQCYASFCESLPELWVSCTGHVIRNHHRISLVPEDYSCGARPRYPIRFTSVVSGGSHFGELFRLLHSKLIFFRSFAIGLQRLATIAWARPAGA